MTIGWSVPPPATKVLGFWLLIVLLDGRFRLFIVFFGSTCDFYLFLRLLRLLIPKVQARCGRSSRGRGRG